MKFTLLTICAGVLSLTSAIKPSRPLVILHGTGDSCCSEKSSTGKLASYISKSFPGLYVKSLALADNEENDMYATYFGSCHQRVKDMCKTLAADPKLKDGFDAVGFSLGGLLMRGYIEECNNPPVHTFISYGAPHSGIAGDPGCLFEDDVLCNTMRSTLRSGTYSDWTQKNAMHAQFYKDVNNLDEYLKKSGYLPDLNNERATKNASYKKNLASLNKFVMIAFTKENVLIPPESAQFGFYKGNSNKTVLSMKQQKIYKEDWIGLKTLDKKGKLVLDQLPGKHMALPKETFAATLKKHLWRK
jgi:palmitoyl-protein thioesterase